MSLELKAREILEHGDVKEFERFVHKNSEKINIEYLFNGRIGFPIILLQTYRSAESVFRDQSKKVLIESYKHCLMFLMEVGCNLDVQDEMGKTFAHFTILFHCLEMLAIALELGCDALLQDSEGETIVHLAIRYNDQMALETIKLYANNSKVFETPSDTSGATPLIYAVQIGAVDIVKKLLQLSVNVDAQENNQYKRTALHYALFTENEEIFTLLLKNKARADIRDYKDKSVVDRVVENPKDNFLRILTHFSSSEIFSNPSSSSDHVGSYSPIIVACKNGDYSMLCHLLEKEKGLSDKINLLMEDSELRTALHHCADNPDTKCAEKLIELEPKLVGMKDKNGFTALHLATIANNKKMVQLLIRNGCDIKEKDSDGHTSLHWAVVCCATELIDTLLKTDPAILKIIDNHGASPLHYATQSFLSPEGSLQGPIIIEKLLKNNKNGINCVDYDNRTPLLWAASLGITDCCQILLENGADINHRDNNGLSALHCAASRGHYDVVDLLVNTWSMLVDIADKNLCTPLFYAVTLKHMPIIHFLVEQRSNPNHQDIKGRSVAHCAALKGYCDVLDIIRNVGGSLTLKNNNGDLPLHEAAETEKLEVCKLLLERMVQSNEINQIDSINNGGFSPLHKAAQKNYSKICQLLVSFGADINLLTQPDVRKKYGIDKSNLSPLDLATDSRTIKLLKDLNGKRSKDIPKQMTTEIDQNPEPLERKINSSSNKNSNNIQAKSDDLQSNNIKGLRSPNGRISHSPLPLNMESDNSENKRFVPPKKLTSKSDKISLANKSAKQNKFGKGYTPINQPRKNSFDSTNKSKIVGQKRDNEKGLITSKSKEKVGNLENVKLRSNSKTNKNIQKLDPGKDVDNKDFVKATKDDKDCLGIGDHQDSIRSSTPERNNPKRPIERNMILTSLNNEPIPENKKKSETIDSYQKTDQNHSNLNNQVKNDNKITLVSPQNEKIFTNGKENKQNDPKNIPTKKLPNGNQRGPGKLINPSIAETGMIMGDRSLRPIVMVDKRTKSRTIPKKDNVDGDEIDDEMEIPSIFNPTQTMNINIKNHNYNHRRSSKSKPFDFYSRVVKSVKEYESVRDRMRSLSDQRRLGMFQGYSKTTKLDKIPAKNSIKSDKPKKTADQNPNSIELPELTMFDPNSLQNPDFAKKRALFPIPLSKEEQIRFAYEGQSSINTLDLYSHLP